MATVDFSLLDDKERISRMAEVQGEYLAAIRRNSEQRNKAKLGDDFLDVDWGERLRRTHLPNPEVDPVMEKSYQNYLEGIRNKEYSIRSEKRKEVGPLWQKFKTDTLEPEYVSRNLMANGKKIQKLQPDIAAINKAARLGKSELKILKSILPFLKPVGMGLTALGAASYADQAGAAVDMATGPIGGVEEMGVSPEQKDLDIQYLNRIRQLNQRKK